MTDVFPGGHHFERRPPRATLRTGLFTGAMLVLILLASLVAANRIPWLEQYALERNAICYTLFVLFMCIPILRFLRHPLSLFLSAMIGWGIFVIAYDIAGMLFQHLFQVLRTPLEALMEGAVVYGIFAVGSWVTSMLLAARHHPILPRRRRSHDAMHHGR